MVDSWGCQIGPSISFQLKEFLKSDFGCSKLRTESFQLMLKLSFVLHYCSLD